MFEGEISGMESLVSLPCPHSSLAAEAKLFSVKVNISKFIAQQLVSHSRAKGNVNKKRCFVRGD